MMFEAVAFKFCPIHIKLSTSNFKLKKEAVALCIFLLNVIASFLHSAMIAVFFYVAFAPPDDTVDDRYQGQQDEQAAPMFLDAQEIMAQPDFDQDSRHLAKEVGNEMVTVRNMTQGTESSDDDIRRIRDGPAHHDCLDAAIGIEFFQHLALGNDFLCLFAEQRPSQTETDFNADDFPNPGNDDARDEAEDDAIDGQEGDGRQADGIDKGNHENTDADSIEAKRSNVIG